MADLNENKLITLGNLKKYTEKIKELISNNSYQEITYSNLKNLRDNSLLTPGTWYRITDYETTVFNNDNARAAGHPFDVVVLATDVNQLSEDAKAVRSARDTEGYFAHANLAAWKLKYSLDNDSAKFAWAGEGKGVIWEMEDEHNNLCPYDFKNIQFKRSLITSIKENPSEEECAFYGKYAGQAEDGIPSLPDGYAIDSNDSKFLYTFSIITADGTVEDNSLGVDLDSADMGIMHCCRFNRIRNSINEESFMLGLNNNVFVSTYNSADDIENLIVIGNTFGTLCIGNTFVNITMENTFGNECYFNTFGKYSALNTIGNSSISNSFGYGFIYNSFGNGCQYISFGNDCGSNSFGDGCYENSFGNECQNNSFGNECQNNLFGNECQNNLFGNKFKENSFGESCIGNSFGNFSYGNLFGDNCTFNSFGNYFYRNSFGNYYGFNSFENSCAFNSFENECYHNSFGNAAQRNSFGEFCVYNSFGDCCSDNSFGVSGNSNSFGNSCSGNSLGNECHSNSFGNNCTGNTFSNSCAFNLFENECGNNSFGNYCYGNSFGNYCCDNSLGNDCDHNSFGNECNNNSFGDGCGRNSFGNTCNDNSFGDDCPNNSFGNVCINNTFGNNNNANSFGDGCQKNDILNNVKFITVFEGVKYVSIGSTSGTVQNAQVLNGTKGSSSSNKLHIDFTTDVEYTQVARLDSNGKAHITPMLDCTQSDIESIF